MCEKVRDDGVGEDEFSYKKREQDTTEFDSDDDFFHTTEARFRAVAFDFSPGNPGVKIRSENRRGNTAEQMKNLAADPVCGQSGGQASGSWRDDKQRVLASARSAYAWRKA